MISLAKQAAGNPTLLNRLAWARYDQLKAAGKFSVGVLGISLGDVSKIVAGFLTELVGPRVETI